MKRIILIGLLAIFSAGCFKSGHDGKCIWKITSVRPETGFFKTDMVVDFDGERMKIVSGTETAEFPAILTNDRLLADTGMAKILFSVVKTSDSTMVWQELYAATPQVIHLTSIPIH